MTTRVQSACDACDDTGWVPDESGSVTRCACWVEGRRSRRLAAAGIPPRYQHCTLDNFNYGKGFHGALESAHLQCERFVESFLESFPRHEHGLMLVGPVGRGKTHLAVGVFRSILKKTGISGRFVDYRDLLRDIQSSYDPVSETSELQILRPLLQADLLLLDDLGARRPSAWVQDTVTHLLNDRYNRKKWTLVTTNFGDPKNDAEVSLQERVGATLRSRLYEMCRVVEITGGKDYRKQPGPDPKLT